MASAHGSPPAAASEWSAEAWSEARYFLPSAVLTRPAGAPRSWRSEATMVLIDISGFTWLSEQLAARGRVGTEDLIATLNETFTALLTASQDGGDVLKFVGDALLLSYRGGRHQLRACHAAQAMQRELHRVGSVRLAGAKVRLRMSVGVHTGVYDLLLTGTDHVNLIVHGSALDRLLTLQESASAGEVLLSDGTAAALPDHAVGAERNGGRVLGALDPVPPSPPAPVPVLAGPDLRRLLPRILAERPDLLGSESDHRRAAMGFVQVSGFGGLASDERTSRTEELTRVVESACAATGVTLLYTDIAGDGFRYFLTAGAPRAQEDAEGRVIRAAAAVVAADVGLGVRAGVAAGQIFAGAVGAPFRRTYTVMGDVVNLAARLAARAEPGTLLAHRPMLDRSATAFMTREMPALTLKGKAEPVPVSAVTEVVGRRVLDPGDVPFAGRERELAVLTEAAARARSGTGTVIEVVGEPGLGKSRLVAEAAAISGLPVTEVLLDPYGVTVAFHAAGVLVRKALGLSGAVDRESAGRELVARVTVIAPDLLPWLPLVAGVVGATVRDTPEVQDLDVEFRPARTGTVLSELLRRVFPDPRVLLIDDAHWVDPASVDLFTSMFRDVGGRPWVVVLTRRVVQGGLRCGDDLPGTRIPMGPMAAEALAALAQAGSTRPLLPRAVEMFVDRAAGNPLFLLELVRAGAEDWASLPSKVEDVVASGVDALSVRDRDLLRRMAVWGTRIPRRLFAALAREDDELRSLARFVEDTPGGDVLFRRDLYREVAYEQLTYRRRRELHRQVAAVITEEPDLAGPAALPMLSLHHYMAGDWTAAREVSELAAEAALAQSANEEAAALYGRAISAGRRAPASGDSLRSLYVRWAETLRVIGRYSEAAAAYAVARRGATDPSLAAELTCALAGVRSDEGRYDLALAAVRRARSLAATLSGEEKLLRSTEIALREAGIYMRIGRDREALGLTLEAAADAERLSEGSKRTRLLAGCYMLHDTLASEIDDAVPRFGDAPLRMFEELGDQRGQVRTASNLGALRYYAGDWAAAIRYYRLAVDLARRIGDVSRVAVGEMNIGELYGYQGRLVESRKLLSSSVQTFLALGTPHPAAYGSCFLGVTETRAGDWTAAAAWFDQAERLFSEGGETDRLGFDELLVRKCELLQARGAHEQAIAAASEFLGRSTPAVARHRALAWRARALAQAASGNLRGARADAARACDEAALADAVYDQALVALVRARLTGDEVAADRCEQQLRSFGVVDLAVLAPEPPAV